MGWLAWLCAGGWLDGGRCPGCGLCHRAGGDSRGHFGCRASAAVSGRGAGDAEPGHHADQPGVQRGRDSGCAVPLLAAGADGRAPGPGPHRRDAARCHRRIGHPGGTAHRRGRLRRGDRGSPDPAGLLAGADPPTCRGYARSPGPGDPGSGAGGPGRRGGLYWRDLRDRRRRDLGACADRVGPAGIGGCSCRTGLHVRDLGRRRDHVHDPVLVSPRRGGSGLVCWPRAGCRGPGRRVYRCAYPVPDA
jgi:hypothetical protein